MRIKSGKELTQLEIIKRLNLMGVKFDSTINGKNYYINLYNKQIISPSKKEKIKQELEKDKVYLDYLTNNLRKTKGTSIEYLADENIIATNNLNKKYLFDDFNIVLFNRILLFYNTFNFIDNNKKIIKKKLDIPVNIIITFISAFACPEICNIYHTFLNNLEKIIDLDIYHYLHIIIFICVVIIFLFFSIKSRIQKKFQKRKNSPLFF